MGPSGLPALDSEDHRVANGACAGRSLAIHCARLTTDGMLAAKPTSQLEFRLINQ